MLVYVDRWFDHLSNIVFLMNLLVNDLSWVPLLRP